jgi:hypothetical protein
LEPINIFLYSWRFLATLEQHALNACGKRSYHWFAVISGLAVPLIYYGLFVSLVISVGYYFEYNYAPPAPQDPHNVAYWEHVRNMLVETIGYWTACTNFVACIVMTFVIHLVFKLTRSAVTGHASI